MLKKNKTHFWIALVGNALEHRDKALFKFLAPFISPLFFPDSDLITAIIYTYGILFLTLLAKPVGAIFFGLWADRIGRKEVLSITLIGMAIATFAMGCLPSYREVGFYSPLLLIIFRAMQNFFAVGESNTAAVFVIEHASEKVKTLISSLYEMSTVLGILMALGELVFLNSLNYLEQGWRILFWAGGLVGLCGYFCRRRFFESEEFQNCQKIKKITFKDFKLESKNLIAITLTSCFSYATYMVSIAFINGALIFGEKSTLRQLMMILFLEALLLPVFGLIANKLGSERVMLFTSGVVGILSCLLPSFEIGHGLLGTQMSIVILGVAFAACFRSWAQERVFAARRCFTLSLGCAISQLLVEGPFTILSLLAIKSVPGMAIPCIFLSLTSLGAFSTVYYYIKVPTLVSSRL